MGLSDIIVPLSNGQATKEEFENLGDEARKTLIKIVIPKGAKVGKDAFAYCPNNMEISRDASEETKNIIRRQIGAIK